MKSKLDNDKQFDHLIKLKKIKYEDAKTAPFEDIIFKSESSIYKNNQ